MINVFADAGSGGTFLTWTLHYLAGHHQYYLEQNKQWIPLTANPLNNNKNAHGFIPNQPNRIFNCNTHAFHCFVKNLESIRTDNFHTLYFHPFRDNNTTQAALEYINTSDKKLLIVDTSDTALYHCSYRKRSQTFTDSGKILCSDKDIHDYFINKYLSESKEIWDSLRLTQVWDVREFLALNARPLSVEHVYKAVDKTRDHFVIKGLELWTSIEINSLFEYCNIVTNKQRLETWKEIYSNWKTRHQQRFMFSTYFNTIIDSILHNYSLDLLRFDLDIEQEAAIQHVLIYNHNLNLKTWQLEKFVNTKQLHNLLEPNIHPLSR